MEKIYLHGIEKNNGIVFSNLGVTNGILFSPEYIHNAPVGYITTFPAGKFPEGNMMAYIMKTSNAPSEDNYASAKDISVAELKSNPNSIKNFVGRRSAWYIWAGAILRNGGKIGIGVPPYDTNWLRDKEKERIIRVSNLELKFEEIRREINLELPSRLTSLYLADNNSNGHKVIESSIKNNYEEFRVKIVDCESFAKVDMRWIDMYSDSPKVEFIENYWLGNPASGNNEDCHWEYLLEGSIELIDKSNLKTIQALGVELLNKSSSG
ncbi:MAG: hypothetical protein WAV73_04420 [Candidatus Moraniibacteriota bacterium]